MADSAVSHQALRALVSQAVREELSAGLGGIRQIVREELDRESEGGEEESSEEECSEEEDRKLVICVRSDLGMTMGKMAAQVGHAVHHAVKESRWGELRAWEATGAKKVTLRVESEEELLKVQQRALQRGLVAQSIQDAGHTELEPGTTTVLSLGPDSVRNIDAVTGSLRPFPDPTQKLRSENEKLRKRAERLQQELDDMKRQKRKMLQLIGLSRAYI